MPSVLTPIFRGGHNMSENDLVHLQANFQDWLDTRGKGLKGDIEPFLYYSVDQILKPFNLSDEDTEYGITDDPLDGGIDAIYFLVNRNTLVRDDLDVRTSGTSRIRLVMVQVKSSLNETGYKAIEVEKFRLFTEDLLNLGRDASTLTHKYHSHLLTIMRTFKQRYIQLAGNFPDIAIDYYYVTRGDETVLGPDVEEAIDRLKGAVKALLPDAVCEFYPINTQALLAYVKKRKQKARTVSWSDIPLLYEGVYVGLVRLADYIEFLKDENGDLDESLFESNVRGYQRNTPVNREMRATLNPDSSADERIKKRSEMNFWLLNNGVTIISSGRFKPLPPRQLSIEDPQIVNGLQTSREIFNYYKDKKDTLNNDVRSVLVKAIPINDDVQRDVIIKATNSQNTMSSASLRATEYIHYSIESLFKRFDLYYDRRKGFHKDQGIPAAKIVSVSELVQSLVATVLHKPNDARGRPGDYISKDKEYSKLFKKDALPLSTYLKCVKIIREIDSFLLQKKVEKGHQRNIKFYMAYYLVSDLSRKLNPTAEDILSLDLDLITTTNLESCFKSVWEPYEVLSNLAENPDSAAKGPDLLRMLRLELAEQYGSEEEETPSPTKKRKVRDVIKDSGL